MPSGPVGLQGSISDPRGLCERRLHRLRLPLHRPGRSYPTCTRDRSWARWTLWCATTTRYDQDSRWKRCYGTEYGGNTGGQPCIFPFVYRGRAFYTCTDEAAKPRRFWCATTGNYDWDRLWSYCFNTHKDGQHGVWGGKGNRTYQGCTADGDASRRPWCSLTRNYDVDQKRMYCLDSGSPVLHTVKQAAPETQFYVGSVCPAPSAPHLFQDQDGE
ncbi:unnamed protein product [Caretta caretta]